MQDVLFSADAEKTQAEKAYRMLREDIVSGALAPGLKLKIDMLRERYDIGAGPLREALARLSGEHLVTLLGQRGFLVAPMSVEDAREIGHLRKLLEADALAQSIPAGDLAWEEKVITTWHRLERVERADRQGLERMPEWERLNQDFHDALVAACPSAWLLRMRAMMFRHHERYRRLSRQKTVLTRDIHLEHRALLDAALDRNVEQAITVIRSHIEHTTNAVVAALGNNPEAEAILALSEQAG
ncbi:GntR family transcriptional regulator [Nitratireductor indicus]|uniref:Transcriptional regulator protein n=1 Tax=Nitratireductor indicus C115 TaxID=1231190 RepID=K2NQ78_9HYPH|nr:FCD domain-containing protein [Nitratireductor indicus]EKF40014.1 transcriptional regulator protein [Nitratireductor indicus C115]MDS1138147.1 FCD domain-containing protein [Nitratireductor indicus]SFQ79950.1 DNA-binding transcriptional regulator, GntR family [Nitratireductor indicus]